MGFSLQWLLLLWRTSSRERRLQQVQLTGSVAAAHGLNCSEARGIFLDQGLNMSLLHWQADSLPLRHQGSPAPVLLPGESHGQRSLVGHSLWGPKEWDTTEVTWHAYTCGESGRNVAVSWLCTILPVEMSAWDLRAWAWGPAWGGRKLRWSGWHTSLYGLGTRVPCAHNQMKSDEGWRLSKLKVPLSPAVENFYLRKHFSVLCLLLWATLLNLIYAFSWRKSCVSLWKVSFLRDGSRGGS